MTNACPSDHSKRLPSFLVALEPVEGGQMQRIAKNFRSVFEADAVLRPVREVFGLVPFEAHENHTYG